MSEHVMYNDLDSLSICRAILIIQDKRDIIIEFVFDRFGYVWCCSHAPDDEDVEWKQTVFYVENFKDLDMAIGKLKRKGFAIEWADGWGPNSRELIKQVSIGNGFAWDLSKK